MTALELHGKHPHLDMAPILRVIKYMGLDSNSLGPTDVEQILALYSQFERDPELVVGTEAICRKVGIEAARLTEILRRHRREIPCLGSVERPMVPTVAVQMIRAIVDGRDPDPSKGRGLYSLTEVAGQTGISIASLSKYSKEHPDRIPSEQVGRMRKFPPEAIEVFRQIKKENMGRRGSNHAKAERQKAALNRRFAQRLSDIEEQLEGAIQVSKELAKTLTSVTRQVKRVRVLADSAASPRIAAAPGRSRRSGVQRPNTIVAACKTVLSAAPEPMRVADITDRVIRMGTEIRAKNPNVTVSSILSSYEDFTRVRRGYYELSAAGALNAAGEGGDGAPATLVEAGDSAPASGDASNDHLAEADPGTLLAELRTAANAGESI